MQEEKQQPQKTKPQQQIVRRTIKPWVSNDSRNLSQRTLGYGRLKEWASFENEGQLVLFMSSQKHQIKEFLGQDTIDQGLFRLLVQSITFAIKANHQQESVKNVLEVLCQTKFLNEFSVNCLNELQERKFLEEAKNFVMSMIDIMSSVLVHLPEQAFKVVVAVALAENTLRQGGFSEELSHILISVQELNKMAKHVHGENEKYAPKRGSGKYVRKRVDETPPDNFRYLPVLPTPYDLQENCNPFIRAVCIDTSYQDIDHYLDIQYRLMRQDFLIPLRQGINMLRANKGNKHLKSTDLNLWLYKDVTIEGTIFQSGYNHLLLIPKLKSSDWRRGKRFMLGSLLCLSDDNFQTIVFATVSLRDETMMDDGKIGVKIQSGLDIIFNNKMGAVYEVAEAVTFFEPYLQVLIGLQEISKLPLQDYIIECNKDLKPPQYLLHSRSVPCYDLKCMMGDQESDTSVPVLTTVKWPPASSMLLNQSQRDAAMLALTKEMALIQGPPGTGKTYVGLKVMETLLTNRKTISPGDKRAPILVVCYTNHALDQFLEGVLKFCKSGIVRVGGSSRSDVLKPFHYIALRSASRKNKENNSISVRTSRYESYQEMKEIGKKLNDLDGAMDALELQIQDEVMFKGFMREAHFQSLQRDAHLIKGKAVMRAWLNAPVGSPEDVLLRSTEVNLSKLVLKWPFVSEDDARITDMGILERASVYQLYVRWVREEIDNRIAVALNDGRHPEMDKLVEKYKEMESRSHQEILPDEHVITFLPKQILTNIQCILDEASLPVGSKIKFWTLGLSGSLESQMKEIETLKNAIEDVEKGIYDFYRQSDLEEDELSSIDSDASDDVDTKDDDDDDVSSAAGRRPDIVTRKSFLPTLHKAVQLDLDRDAEDDEGFVTVSRRKPLSLQKLLRMLNREPMTEEEEEKVEDVWSLNVDRRFALYNLWASRYKRKLTDEMEFEVERYNTVFKKCQEIDREEMIAILGKANVIGMTTTGAAKHRAVLRALGCKIVVVEEAAEVLESHIVTALSENCQHLILIGDHQQLRPKPTVYDLAKNYGLEISLFERFVKNDFPHVVLRAQRRMRPEISLLMRHIYPHLEDDPSVREYDSIKGVGKNVFLVNHNEVETAVVEGCSKANEHEAQYVIELCKYLFTQGYTAEDITILATYSGQVHAIRKLSHNSAVRLVRISAVDDFQGEENDIILLSLVRSNEENNVGFLKVDNRVCVALSRAKKGLYVIGNFDLLASQSKLWTRIVETAKKEKIIGEGLPVVCQNHPGDTRSMTRPQDFNTHPDGGCGQPCKYRLNCGHTCDRLCHMDDREHDRRLCSKICSKICPDGHTVTYKCFETDGQCRELVLRSMPSCGHSEKVSCHVSPDSVTCSQPCPVVLSCGHQCSETCGRCQKEGSHPECSVTVEHTWACGHMSNLACYQISTNPPCNKPCEAILLCGHPCAGTCSSCATETGHAACKEPCHEVFPCGHTCKGTCSKCHKDAEHQACDEMCTQTLQCGHRCQGNCYKCREDSEHKVCTEGCSQILPCGHGCSGKCSSCRTDTGHPDCKQLCQQLLSCGHTCPGVCSSCHSVNGHPDCQQLCQQLLSCGHMCPGVCSSCRTDTDHPDCQQLCQQLLSCGHKCPGVCSSCRTDTVHVACGVKCPLRLPCGHGCKGKCGEPCLPCTEICPNYCKHTSCSSRKRTCSQRCVPCKEFCVQKCQHGQILKQCSGKWETKPCDKPCSRRIFRFFSTPNKGNTRCCVHPCSGICSELCVCSICEKIIHIKARSKKSNKADFASSLGRKNTNEGAQQENPIKQNLIIKIPSCSHIFYLDELDAYVAEFEPGGTSLIPCPACKKPIMNCLRYDNVNVERRARRAALSAEVDMDQKISPEDNGKLIRSVKTLRKLPFVEDIKELCSGDICCSEELLSLSFKLKSAFVMAEIIFLQGEGRNNVVPALNALKAKLMKTSYPEMEGMIDEVKIEILRCLKLAAITKFHALSLAHNLTLPANLQAQVEACNQRLSKAKPEQKSLEEATGVILSLSKFLTTCSLAALPESRKVISVYNQAIKVLSAPYDKMLCDLDLITDPAAV